MSERAPASLAARHGPLGPLSAFLERFRRSGGVPATVGGDAAVELAAVFVALDQLEREAEEVRRSASTATLEREREFDREALRIVADARKRAETERQAIVKERLRIADAEAAAIVARAEADAAKIGATGDDRLPGFVAEILAQVLEAGS